MKHRCLFLCLLSLATPTFTGARASDDSWDVAAPHGPYRDVTFTVEEGTWMSVDVSPDGETLVFDLLGDIYRVSASGGEAEPIHRGPALQVMPAFSADGAHLLYLSDAGGSDNAWISRADGSEASPVSSETVNVVTTPVWGPEGYVVAAKTYAQASETGSSELRLYHRRGGSGRLLVAKPANGTNVFEPEVSPDGRWLYYTERVSDMHPSHVFIDPNQINFAVMARDLRDGSTREAAGGFGGATTPQISPDGQQLAFVRRVKDRTVLFVLDLESGDERPVFDGLDRDAQASFIPQGTYYPRFGWFPDNRHVAIWAGGRIQRVDTETGEAAPIPIRITATHRLTEAPRFALDPAPQSFRVRALQQASLAPDGEALAFAALGRVWTAAPGAEAERVDEAQAIQADPAHAPDGRSIVYAEWRDEEGGALMLARNGRTPQVVAKSEGIIREPAFSPDGSTLAYRIAPGDKCMGGYGAEPGLHLVSADGRGDPVALGRDGRMPRFGPSGERLYFTDDSGGVLALKSVDRTGQQPRTHLVAGSEDVSDLSLSPDLLWAAFRQNQRVYVVPYRETGSPLTLDAASDEVPVLEVSQRHGYGLGWTGDSTLFWLEGPTVRRTRIEGGPRGATARPSGATTVQLTLETDVPQGALALTNATLITMRGDEVVENGVVVVRGNRIAAAGPASEVKVPGDARVLDMSGKTILPGLVDMHGHLDDCYYSNTGISPQKLPSHHAALAFGVTTNFDPYTSDLPGFAVSEARQAGLTVGPRLIQTGRPLHGRSGRPDGAYVPIADIEDARRALRLKAALGAPFIKSYKQPMRSQRQQIVEAARAQSIMADVEGESHFYFNLSMILDGYTILDHNLPVATYYDDLVRLMAASSIAHTPTLIIVFGGQLGENYLYQTTRSWEDPRIQAFVPETTSGYSAIPTPHGAPPHVRGMITAHVAEELYDIGFRSVARSMKRLDEAGVLVNTGGHGQIQGLALHWEMWLLAEGGMSNHRVLRAATLNGARSLGLDAHVGTLDAGKLADLIVLDENPLENIRHTRSVRYSMVNGRLYDAMTLDEIGNYDRPRGRFYWEPAAEESTWRSSWTEQ